MKLLLLVCLFSAQIFSQTFSINGIVKDSSNGEILSSANIFISELNTGTTSDEHGEFLLEELKYGKYTIRFSFIGYAAKEIVINLKADKKIEIFLLQIPILFDKAVIEGTIPKFRETAVAFSELSHRDIETRLGSKEAVNILEGIPSTYVTQQGGGIGEQRLNIRGFDQTNIAVMINGIPINNPENGEIYWSNWAGISDLVKYVHVQRGLSAIPYSTSAIGGSVNFVTMGNGNLDPSFRLKTEFGSYNLHKSSISFSSQLSNNIGLTGLISRRTINGYAEQVYSDEFTYYFALGMVFSKHSLQVQLFGSPQKHGQRLTQQTIKDWTNYGKRYNADWGYLNGKPLNLRDNEFHNPTLNINYNWQISNKLIWTNILSLSHGTGGGTVPPWYPELSKTQTGLIDFDKEWQLNSNNVDPNYHNTLNKSVIALRKGVHKNYWGTLISVFKYDINNFTLSGGFDGKLYEAQNYNEISNLLGGDYQVWSNNINDDPNRLLTVGDKVDFNADSFTRSYGTFFQTEYKNEKISAYLNLAVSNTEYNRIDYFNYLNNDPNRETGWKSFTSTTLKTGINYNIDDNHNVYLNIGNFSRAPLSMNVYDYSNNLYENTKNEKILSLEFGYGLQTSFSKININYFNTLWKNKAFSQSFLNNDSTAIYYYNIFGASAVHSGIEFDGVFKLAKNLTVNSMFSYSNNKWGSDIDAFARPESNPNDEIKYHAFTEDLYVGNYPMLTASLGLFYENLITKNTKFYVNPLYNFFGRYYAQFNPELRTNESEKKIQPWKLPDFFNIDFHSGIIFNLENKFIKSFNLSLDIFNILNSEYIIDAKDGISHDSKTATVWYGNERWWSASITVTM